VIFDGRNGGTVELLDSVLVIRRKGVASFLTQGLKGEKRIPYSSITSVQFKEAGFTTGYIQFGLAGGIESRRGVWDATTDENTILFTKEASSEFHRLRDIVEERAAAARGGHASSHLPSSPSNVSEELSRLADLRDRGVLTDAEFAEQKAHLLGTSRPRSAQPQSAPHMPTSSISNHAQSPVQAMKDPSGENRRRGIGKAIGIGCLGILGLLVVLAAIGSQVEPTDNAVDSASPDNLASESEAATEISAELPVSVTATELFNAYQNNEASAQGYFGDRKLLVSGTVDKVTLDFMDDPVVGLRTPNQFMSAQAALAEDAEGEAGNFNPGDRVTLLCENVSEVAATPMLKDCRTAPAGMKGQPVQWAD
jgi:hypothetical protein